MAAEVLFRCDASPVLGAGHVVRCLAFAETLSWAGWSCRFAVAPGTSASVPALGVSGVAVDELNDLSAKAQFHDDTRVVVVDHYQLDAAAEADLAGEGRCVVAFDDLADRTHACDILVDPTPGRLPAEYRPKVPAQARLLLGPSYAIVRRAWRGRRAATRTRLNEGAPVRRILVSMGATDPVDSTSQVITALQRGKIDVDVDVVLGAAARNVETVKRLIGARMKLHVEPADLAGLAAQADLAIGAPGTSSFERAVLGIPALLIPIADNQRFVAAAFTAAGAAQVVPAELLNQPQDLAMAISALIADNARRVRMAQAAAYLTDGRGTLRLLLVLAGATAVRTGREASLRLAEPEDEAWLLALQSQPETRRHARRPFVPSAREHAQWFARTLDDPERLLAIIDIDGKPAGMVRLDRATDARPTFEVSIAIDSGLHGQGIGAAALSLVRQAVPAADLIATVLPENRASLALFAGAGYQPEGEHRYRSRTA